MSGSSEPVSYSFFLGVFLRPAQLCSDQPSHPRCLSEKEHLEAEPILLLTPQHPEQDSGNRWVGLGGETQTGGDGQKWDELIPAAPELQPQSRGQGRGGHKGIQVM